MIQQAYKYVSWSLCPCLNFRTQISREKKIKIQRSSKIIVIHKELSSKHIEIYIRFNRRKNEYFRIFFSSGLTKIWDYDFTPKLRFANKSLQNTNFEAIYDYLFNVNRYHTSAKEKSVPYQSSFIVLKFQPNTTKPELIRILSVTPLDLIDSTKEARIGHSKGNPKTRKTETGIGIRNPESGIRKPQITENKFFKLAKIILDSFCR